MAHQAVFGVAVPGGVNPGAYVLQVNSAVRVLIGPWRDRGITWQTSPTTAGPLLIALCGPRPDTLRDARRQLMTGLARGGMLVIERLPAKGALSQLATDVLYVLSTGSSQRVTQLAKDLEVTIDELESAITELDRQGYAQSANYRVCTITDSGRTHLAKHPHPVGRKAAMDYFAAQKPGTRVSIADLVAACSVRDVVVRVTLNRLVKEGMIARAGTMIRQPGDSPRMPMLYCLTPLGAEVGHTYVPPGQQKRQVSPWGKHNPARHLVLETMLGDLDRRWTVPELAGLTGVTIRGVGTVLTHGLTRELIAREATGDGHNAYAYWFTPDGLAAAKEYVGQHQVAALGGDRPGPRTFTVTLDTTPDRMAMLLQTLQQFAGRQGVEVLEVE